MNHARKLIGVAVATAATCLGSTGTIAHGTNEAKLDEVLITARRAVESLQEVPIAISAFSSDEMRWRNMRELEDLDIFDLALAPFLDPETIVISPTDGVQGLQKFNLGITTNAFDTDAIFARVAYETCYVRVFNEVQRQPETQASLTATLAGAVAGKGTIAFWWKNIFDEEYGANSLATTLPTSTGYAQIFGKKARFGPTVAYEL